MTSKERILAAIRNMEPDYVPMVIEWNEEIRHEKLGWKNDRQKLEEHQAKKWDTYLCVNPVVSPAKSVTIVSKTTGDAGNSTLTQIWKTPAGEITERLRATEDWDELRDERPYLQFASDFRTSRYLDFPFKSADDLDSLEYLFPAENSADEESICKDFDQKRKLADEFEVPLFVYLDSGMDWLVWLYPPEEAIVRIVSDPEFIHKLLDRINDSKRRRLEILLRLGIDGVMRRGWYESTDLWNPSIFREFAMPELELEIDMTHRAGIPYIYIMDTGIKPLLPELATLKFDCLLGADPVLGKQDIGELRKALPGKAIWGGLSGPGHFGAKTPEKASDAVKNAIEKCGKRGLILGMSVSFRHYWPWGNFEAAETTWKMMR